MKNIKLFEEFKENIDKNEIIYYEIINGLSKNIPLDETIKRLKNEKKVKRLDIYNFFNSLTDEQKSEINKYNKEMSNNHKSSIIGSGVINTGKILPYDDYYKSKITQSGYDTGFKDTYDRKLNDIR